MQNSQQAVIFGYTIVMPEYSFVFTADLDSDCHVTLPQTVTDIEC